MLRGAIDLIHPERVGGWIYSDARSVRGETVLAFVDGQCIGAGTVDIFRKDLEEAGLGDGYLGFSFPVSLANPNQAPRTVVKLDGSDFVLLPPNATIQINNRKDGFANPGLSIESIEFMRTRGWLDATDYTFMKYLVQFGVFDYSLKKPKHGVAPDIGPDAVARDHLNLLVQNSLPVTELEVIGSDIVGLAHLLKSKLTRPCPVVGILADQTGNLLLLEGSHADEKASESDAGAVGYPFGPDRLLFLNAFCSFKLEPKSENARFKLWALG